MHSCLDIKPKKIFDLQQLIDDPTYPVFIKGYQEDRFPAPAMFFHRTELPSGEVEFRAERLKVGVPPKIGNYFYITLENGDVVPLR